MTTTQDPERAQPAAPTTPPAAPPAPSGQPAAGFPHPGVAAAPPPPTAPPVAPPPPTTPPVVTSPPPAGTDGPQVVRTDADAQDGLAKCPRCGATEISLNTASGLLRCLFCRHEWGKQDDELFINQDIRTLTGLVIGSGSQDIVASTDEVLTFKCTACGAEVVVNTAESTQARCHWCRNKLSVNQQIPNGAVPDMVLPFRLRKEDAVERIRGFVKKRRAFAHPRFLKEFAPENVMGVYLPYMVVDINAHARFAGEGEHCTRTYMVGSGDRKRRVYDADVYRVRRELDIYINDLTVEAAAERRNQDTSLNSNNIINAIMPFDVENSVRYDANYIAGFTSERRDSNIAELAPLVERQARDVTRHRVADETLGFYDRGVRWDRQEVDIRGQRWAAAYLPVWLYSYHEKRSNGRSFLHYVAVNGRTGETMGSVPVNHPKLLAVAGVVQVVGMVLGTIVMAVT
ncbi:TFIIB-type zinc ribbon-containing protein [uncultured Georgenia sp.]|uniref:TFIIB-type zinc ribbon-containing protein n=1 Tax=uncultured Georgenia sp. TaxID=378209 RepID=UPI00260FF725|nr:TFIIB-type zinc ribbon-containing protein [uncultured Georgenia sp.]